MIEAIEFLYNGAWHIWAIVKDGVVIQCFLKVAAAKKQKKSLNLPNDL